MSTDIAAQRDSIIAKDLVIAALEAKQFHLSGGGPQTKGDELAQFYNALLAGISKGNKGPTG